MAEYRHTAWSVSNGLFANHRALMYGTVKCTSSALKLRKTHDSGLGSSFGLHGMELLFKTKVPLDLAQNWMPNDHRLR